MSTQGNQEQWSQPQNPFPVQPDQQDAESQSQDPSLPPDQQPTAQSQPAYQPASQNVDPSASPVASSSDQANATDDSSLAGPRSQAQQQVNNAIDQLAQKIPGGDRIAKQAKDAASGILDSLEQQGGKLMGNLGGIFGGQKDKP